MPTDTFGSFEKVLRMGEGRRLKRLASQADYIATLEPEFEKLSDEEVKGKTAEFRQRVENGEALEDLLFEAFATVREAFKRTMDIRLFDVQMMGGIVLHEGDIAEPRGIVDHFGIEAQRTESGMQADRDLVEGVAV